MPRTCTVCTHAERSVIDQELVSGVSVREVAKRHASLDPSSVYRHAKRHIANQLAQAEEAKHAEGVRDAAWLVAQIHAMIDASQDDEATLRGYIAEIERLVGESKVAAVPMALKCLAEVTRTTAARRDTLELLVKAELCRNLTPPAGSAPATDELSPALQRLVDNVMAGSPLPADSEGERPSEPSLVHSAEWRQVRCALVRALGPYPDARHAVICALTQQKYEPQHKESAALPAPAQNDHGAHVDAPPLRDPASGDQIAQGGPLARPGAVVWEAVASVPESALGACGQPQDTFQEQTGGRS